MKTTRIAVLGANGQLGQSLQHRVSTKNPSEDWCFFSSSAIDITKKKQVASLFEKDNSFDYIVNCAAYTAVDHAEKEPEKAAEINSSALEYLAACCQEQNTILIHISTDYVFDGNFNQPISELATPNPINVYGQTKYAGEKNITTNTKKYFILRTGWLYSEYPNNFFTTIKNLAQKKKSLNVVYDQIGTPTHTDVLVQIITSIIYTQSKSFGIYHAANEGVASWYDFAYEILQLGKSDCQLNPISTKEYPTPAQRPLYSVLDKSKLKKEFKLQIPHWKESLKTCF